MKKFYLLLLLFVSTSVMAQAPIITMISDGDCAGGKPNVIELYAQGTVDFSNFSVELQTNANTTWGNTTNLAALGTVTDQFVYIFRDTDAAEFATEYPNVTGTAIAGALNFNGDDRVRIILDFNSNVIDQYGVESQDGSGQPWDYIDGYAKRIDASTQNGGNFNVANWTVNTSALDGLGLCQGGANSYETIIGLGTFVANTTPTVATTTNLITGFTQFLGTPSAEQSFNAGGTNLTADITVTVTSGDYEISETSGGTFGNSITLTQVGGIVAPTTIYVRLNGTAIASPSNGDITVSSAGATDEVVVLEGEILSPAPTVFVSTNSLTGFSHFVGTPSAEQSFDVSGDFLTGNLTVTAPTNYEVSLTSGTGFANSVSIPPSSGSVTTTPVYVRLNGPAANSTQNGDVTVTSSAANTELITLEGETFEYVLYPIGAVTTNDANGEVDSLDVYAELRGIVHCIDFDGNAGYNFTIIDGEGDGINIFNFNDVDGYVVTEGDSIGVKGQIGQFNGLTQIFAEEITVFSQANAIVTPVVVTALDETTESQFVTLENLTLVNGEATWPNNGNIDVTDGTNTYLVRVPGASPLAGVATPTGPFDMTGLGAQYDNSTPYDEGYQLFPCSLTELCNVDVSTTVSEITITAAAMGVDYQWVDCDDNYSFITGETNQAFTATQNGNYAVIITDGVCVDTSSCTEIATVGLSTNDLSERINLYPNPISNEMHINVSDDIILSVEVMTVSGQTVYAESLNESNADISTSSWESGVYFVNVTTANGNAILKVVK
jgi:hypothetical protein